MSNDSENSINVATLESKDPRYNLVSPDCVFCEFYKTACIGHKKCKQEQNSER